ncbi:MAG: hypothetical protein WCV67_07130 [Victivallaceae bacterium]|jgi:hypothetical protein
MISKKKKFLFCLILIIIPALALLLLEVALRLFWPQPPRGFSDNLFTERDGVSAIRDGVRGRQYSREFDVTITGNALGYRDCPGFNPAKRPDLIILGDSFCFGWGVEAADTAGARLAQKQGWNVYLAGMPGDAIFTEKKRLELLKSEKCPAIVLLFFDNDLSDCISLRNNPRPEATGAVTPNSPGGTGLRWKLLESHAARLTARIIDLCGLSNLIANVAGSDKLQAQAIKTVMAVHRKEFFDSPAWNILQKEYIDFIKTAKNRTDRLIVIRITPPFFTALMKDHNKNYDFKLCNETLKNLFAANYVPYYVFEPEDTAKCYFKYDMHLTPAGHQELADFISDKLVNSQEEKK